MAITFIVLLRGLLYASDSQLERRFTVFGIVILSPSPSQLKSTRLAPSHSVVLVCYSFPLQSSFSSPSPRPLLFSRCQQLLQAIYTHIKIQNQAPRIREHGLICLSGCRLFYSVQLFFIHSFICKFRDFIFLCTIVRLYSIFTIHSSV